MPFDCYSIRLFPGALEDPKDRIAKLKCANREATGNTLSYLEKTLQFGLIIPYDDRNTEPSPGLLVTVIILQSDQPSF